MTLLTFFIIYMAIGAILFTWFHFTITSKEMEAQVEEALDETIPQQADRDRFYFHTLLLAELEIAFLWPKLVFRLLLAALREHSR